MQTDEQRDLLGAFVRQRRESMAPQGLARRRRTPGLRREELAERAAISTTWVTWIEQGRAVRPSAETLARLAEGLALSLAERRYLFELAGRRDPSAPGAGDAGAAPPSIAALVGSLAWPAYALDPAWSVCCANAAARTLFTGLFDEGPAPNLLVYAFTHPAAHALMPDWGTRVRRLLAEFRHDYSRTMRDPRVKATVEWLLANSPEFLESWENQSVLTREGGSRAFRGPDGGMAEYIQHTLADVERGDFRVVFLEPAGAGEGAKA
ncbi:helix-turn-helix transcriptional regulator [Novosphingobium beihaiensis]|uniref:Helix-turn-helix transcriptional regulator n=1 Tax=Novosphingobium beihaiensis TaxID=2930389 RepID=A0ABT0BLS1_9SPHN|nr:helix-turn-helix transcriptional regulator [Novosphingobium beihaiensis]MCJ2186010.1 helix-turn-helix transcriptional regulator [Novosphingobium beihaiensis]